MSAEIFWLGESVPNNDHRPRCRYCRRTLAAVPLTPAEFEPHCEAQGCRVCLECSEGRTSVSPVRA